MFMHVYWDISHMNYNTFVYVILYLPFPTLPGHIFISGIYNCTKLDL